MGVLGPRSERTGRREPVVVESFHRGLDVFRPLAALYAAWLAWQRHETMVRPWVAGLVIGVMFAWSIGLLFYRRRTVRVVVIEVTIAVVGILATMLAETPEAIAAGQFTIPTIWAAGSVAGGAVVAGARGGLLAAAVIAAADLVEVGHPDPVDRAQHRAARAAGRADRAGGRPGPHRPRARGAGAARARAAARARTHRPGRARRRAAVAGLHPPSRRGDRRRGGRAVRHRRRAGALAAPLRLGHGRTGRVRPADLRGVEGTELDLRVLLTARERPDVAVWCPPTRSSSTARWRSRSTPPSPPRSTTSTGTPGRAREPAAARGRHRPASRSPSATTGPEPTGRPARRDRARPDGRQRLDPRARGGPRWHRDLDDPARRRLRGADDRAANRAAPPGTTPHRTPPARPPPPTSPQEHR